MSKKVKKDVPELRFPEFEEDWQLQKLKNILIESNHLASEGLPLYSLTIESGIVPKTERYERSFLVKNEEEAYKVVQPNDFAYNPMNLRFGALARHTESRPVKISKYYNIFSVTSKANIAFVDYLLTKSSSIRFYDSIAMGSLVEKKRVHFSDFIKCKFLLPSIAEQEKIASFLGAIATRLTQLRRKRELLQTYKRGIMQKLFSQQIRFTQPDGSPFPDWERKKLEEIGSFLGGGTPSTSQQNYWIGDMPWVSSSDLEEDSIHTISITRFINQNAIKESATKTIPPNSILIVSRVGVGKIAVSSRALCTSQDFSNFTPKHGNIYFFAYWLKAHKKKLVSLSQGTSIKGFTNNDLSLLRVDFPCPVEQEKIAAFLTTLDRKIEAFSRQIEQTEQFKKGLLQKLFV